MYSSNVLIYGMVVVFYYFVSQSVLVILCEGGSVIEVMVVVVVVIVVVYFYMNGLGGDGFWLIVLFEGDFIVIDVSGVVGLLVIFVVYVGQWYIFYWGLQVVLIVVGIVSGWDEVLWILWDLIGCVLLVVCLLVDVIGYVEDGILVIVLQVYVIVSKLEELCYQLGFSEIWLVVGEVLWFGSCFCQFVFVGILCMLVSDGFDSFYCGLLVECFVQGMVVLGMFVIFGDLQVYCVWCLVLLMFQYQQGMLWNFVLFMQGLVLLVIFGIIDCLKMVDVDEV